MLKNLIDTLEHDIFTEWVEKIPEKSEEYLLQCLLKVSDENLLELNFDPNLAVMLQEIRDIIILKKSDLPDEVIDLHNRSIFFFETICNLNLIINWYVHT